MATSFYDDMMERKRRMLPMSLGASSPDGVLTQNVQTGAALPRSLQIRKQIADLESQDDDMSAMQAYARQQGEAGQTAMLNALAAQFAGERFEPVQAQFLKRAAAAQQPMKVGRGMVTPDGQYIVDPGARREAQLGRLSREADLADRLEAQAASQAERLQAQRDAQQAAAEARREQALRDEALRREIEAGRQMTARESNQIRRELGMLAAGRAEANRNKPRDMPFGDLRKLSEQAGTATALSALADDFKNDYASPLPGVPGVGSVINYAGRSGIGDKERANWWQRYNEQINLVRNELFGSALTAPERAAFDRAMVGPDMSADVIKKRLDQQAEAAAKAYNRLVQAAEASNFNVTGAPVVPLPSRGGQKPAGGPPPGIDAKVWNAMTPEERALWK